MPAMLRTTFIEIFSYRQSFASDFKNLPVRCQVFLNVLIHCLYLAVCMWVGDVNRQWERDKAEAEGGVIKMHISV